jgi:hypothetical protein
MRLALVSVGELGERPSSFKVLKRKAGVEAGETRGIPGGSAHSGRPPWRI